MSNYLPYPFTVVLHIKITFKNKNLSPLLSCPVKCKAFPGLESLPLLLLSKKDAGARGENKKGVRTLFLVVKTYSVSEVVGRS